MDFALMFIVILVVSIFGLNQYSFSKKTKEEQRKLKEELKNNKKGGIDFSDYNQQTSGMGSGVL